MLKNIGGPNQREYTEAVTQGFIEDGILPLTEALFDAGTYPLASCEGHSFKRPRSVLSWLRPVPKMEFRPYVMFSATEQYARAYQESYDRLLVRPFYSWWITAHFNPLDYELVWTIEPNDVRLTSGDVINLKVQNDIEVLASVAREASRMLSNSSMKRGTSA